MTNLEELRDMFDAANQMLNDLERGLAAKRETPEAVQATLEKIIGALTYHGLPEPSSDKSPRGLGYGQPGKPELSKDGKDIVYTTPDEAMIVASLPWFKGNMSAAIKAHYVAENLTKEEVDNHADRIFRRHGRQIEEAIGNDHPWETSSNWLGDLPEK